MADSPDPAGPSSAVGGAHRGGGCGGVLGWGWVVSFDEFMRYVRLLSNQAWVRYYLMERPGQIVLEVAKPSREWDACDGLNKDLQEKGFSALPYLHYSGWVMRRWSIKRVEAERAEGGR